MTAEDTAFAIEDRLRSGKSDCLTAGKLAQLARQPLVWWPGLSPRGHELGSATVQ